MRALYSAVTGGAVALAAATAKTVIGVKGGAAFGLDLVGVEIAFDGASATAVPVLLEICYNTWATNAPGTNSTSITPTQLNGRVIAHGVSAAKTWTSEPTALTVLDEILVHPQSGIWIPVQIGQEYDCDLNNGFSIRATAPAIVNVRMTMKWARN